MVDTPTTLRKEQRWMEERKIEATLECLNKRSAGRLTGLDKIPGVDRAIVTYRSELQGYVDGWIRSGWNFTKWLKDNPTLAGRLRQTIDKNLRIVLVPHHSGSASAMWLHKTTVDLGKHCPSFAPFEFAQLLCSPLGRDVRRCPRCLDYFLNKSGHRRKTYCGRHCATHTSAEAATRAKRERERAEKLTRVNNALKEWKRGFRRQDWKQWVAIHSEVTVKWLTRAVNKGDLHPPRIRKEGG